MRTLLLVLATALLAAGVLACGSSSKGNLTSSSQAGASTSRLDRDNDGDNNDDDNAFINYGHAATAAERGPLVALITAYFAAAAAENGARACSMLMPFIAESVVENVGHGPGLNGHNCAVVMSKLFKQKHHELQIKSTTLKFYAVRIKGEKALTLLTFKGLAPEVRQVDERRDGSGDWKILTLLDGIIE